MISFHTPELPPKLNLDVAHLDGGGSCPSQFEGYTHDGRDIRVRYRGGRLTVKIAKEIGVRPVEFEQILEADIGPRFDGTISLSQFCQNFDVTIDGEVPAETKDSAYHYNDLTGQTTFWSADLDRVTGETARKLLAACQSCLPNTILVEPTLNERFQLEKLHESTAQSFTSTWGWLIAGASSVAELKINDTGHAIEKNGQLKIALQYNLWQYPKPRFSNMILKKAATELNRTLIVAGTIGMPDEIALAYDTFTLTAQIPSDDAVRRTQLVQLGKAIAPFLPEAQLERVNLQTDETLSILTVPLDPVIPKWCAAGPDRWLSVMKDSRDGPWIGIRPVQSDTLG